jgi:hypothetical protein
MNLALYSSESCPTRHPHDTRAADTSFVETAAEENTARWVPVRDVPARLVLPHSRTRSVQAFGDSDGTRYPETDSRLHRDFS